MIADGAHRVRGTTTMKFGNPARGENAQNKGAGEKGMPMVIGGF
jgi:hypothetical protein